VARIQLLLNYEVSLSCCGVKISVVLPVLAFPQCPSIFLAICISRLRSFHALDSIQTVDVATKIGERRVTEHHYVECTVVPFKRKLPALAYNPNSKVD
jgi:hypothetical protein